ncbi:MAG TPA: glycosyltransferase family 2 protein, partial [Acidobacteriaceae bacterium]|nr:glycosyltransferase family 2 protein [Acidobacteriaceae bacterium]
MAALFWISLALIAYAYAGYAVWLRLFAGTRPRVEAGERFRPAISIVVACRNERENLPRKIDNLERLAYLGTRPEILIASDGSTDGTAELLLGAADRVVPVILPESRGKAMALNAAVRRAKGEIVVFFDARQVVDERALIELAGCFADPEVGAVSGELLLEDPEGEPAGDALGLYWRIEKVVRRLESESGSVVGVTGAIYAIRRELYVELPEGTILDDVLVPMNVAHAGKRVMFQPTAIARDRIFQKPGKEFARKVRTLTGNYQLVQFAPWLVTFRNPLLFRFIS